MILKKLLFFFLLELLSCLALMTSVTLMAVLHFCYSRINLFKLLLCWNLRILWEYSCSLFQMISFLLLATRKSSLCAFHQLHTSQQFSNWCMWLFLFLLSFSKSTEDAWIVFVQVLCGWGNVWGSFSSREKIVVAFHFSGSCFTALGWWHGSVQMIFFLFFMRQLLKASSGGIKQE